MECRHQHQLNRLADLGEIIARVATRRGQTLKAEIAARQAAELRRIASEIQAGDIGKPVRHIDLPGEEPLVVPEFDPEETPVEEPVPA